MTADLVCSLMLKDYLKLHFIVLLWGFTAILGKLLTVPPVELVFWRTALATTAGGAASGVACGWHRDAEVDGGRGTSSRALDYFFPRGALVVGKRVPSWTGYVGAVDVAA
jgi:hypothetical protein